MSQDLEHLTEWIGRTEDLTDFISPTTVEGMSATLDRDDPDVQMGDPVPPAWHWLFFNKAARQSQLGEDGHPARGDFLPPVPLPRRMWAANEAHIHRPLKVGVEINRHSTINDVSVKEGKTGTLVFVEVGHEISDADGLAVSETQTLVYCNQPDPNAVVVGKPAPDGAEWSRTIIPDPVLLFRFSALSFLGHRIHYDRDYTTKVEGYPALLVHGPFTGIMLMDLFRRQSPAAVIKNFTVRAVGPLFDDAPFTLNGRIAGSQVDLWASNRDGNLAMSVTAELE